MSDKIDKTVNALNSASSSTELAKAIIDAFALLDKSFEDRVKVYPPVPPSDEENSMSKAAYAAYERLIEAVGGEEAEKLTS